MNEQRLYYCCDRCGTGADWDREIIWITSSYGVCHHCYDELSEQELEELRVRYE